MSVEFLVDQQPQLYPGHVERASGPNAYVVHFEDGETRTIDPRRDKMRRIDAPAADVDLVESVKIQNMQK